ncbi:hypothetical protein [Rheinheimera tilapiae]|uniref:KfrA N-terminal DNA-binding domain-containing protein n=1 Tax=Rheinheimera tilapiae TaxID=875043 RepID=A0ABV6BHU2_9GAMM
MSTLQNRIGVIATQLQQEGKSPSLALVRARLGGGINPAELFSAYQSWRAQGSPLTKSSEEPGAVTKSSADGKDNANDTAIRQDLARIEAKLDLILTLLQEKS